MTERSLLSPGKGETEAGIERLADAQASQSRDVSQWEDNGLVSAMTPETAGASDGRGAAEPQPDSLDFDSPNKQPHGGVVFENSTRWELRDWINTEIHLGYMTVEESKPLVALTVKISDETGLPVDIETDKERGDFIAMARGGIEGARGDEDDAEHMRAALMMGA